MISKILNSYNLALSKNNQIPVGKILNLIKTTTKLKDLKYIYEKIEFKETPYLRLSSEIARKN